jgi:hypothetical protein
MLKEIKPKNKSRLITGIIVLLLSGILSFFHLTSVSFRITLLILGMAFIATSPFKFMKKK